MYVFPEKKHAIIHKFITLLDTEILEYDTEAEDTIYTGQL